MYLDCKYLVICQGNKNDATKAGQNMKNINLLEEKR